MKKRILLLFVCMLALLFLNINASADTTMYIECDIDATTNLISDISDLDDWMLQSYSGRKFFVRLTDNDGNNFFVPQGVDIALQTQPEITWSAGSISKNFNNGICPKEAAYPDVFGIEFPSTFLFAGTKPYRDILYLEKPRYIIYSYGNNKMIAEGYGGNGAYSFVGPDISLSVIDEIAGHQLKLIANRDVTVFNYFKVDEGYDTLLIAGNGVTGDYSVCEGKPIEWCKNNKNFKIHVASSGEGRTNLDNGVKDWLDDNDDTLDDYDKIIEFIKDTEFIETCEAIDESITNGTEYNINNLNVDDFIDKLQQGREALTEAFGATFTDCATNMRTSAASSITSCVVYSDMLGIREIIEIAEEDDSENILNQGFIIDALYNDVNDSLRTALAEGNYDINIVDASSDLERYTKLFYTATVYLYQKAKNGHESLQGYKDTLESIVGKYNDLVNQEGLNINPVVDCETLLGDKLIEKIDSYVDIIKIAVPIILIGFGIIDFTKAMFAGEDEMKKAQKSFIKRLLVALLIFITPTIIHFLLQLANKVWTVISPGSCGIF